MIRMSVFDCLITQNSKASAVNNQGNTQLTRELLRFANRQLGSRTRTIQELARNMFGASVPLTGLQNISASEHAQLLMGLGLLSTLQPTLFGDSNSIANLQRLLQLLSSSCYQIRQISQVGIVEAAEELQVDSTRLEQFFKKLNLQSDAGLLQRTQQIEEYKEKIRSLEREQTRLRAAMADRKQDIQKSMWQQVEILEQGRISSFQLKQYCSWRNESAQEPQATNCLPKVVNLSKTGSQYPKSLRHWLLLALFVTGLYMLVTLLNQ